MDKNNSFHYGALTKTELAQLYFPERLPASARRKLNYWIAHNKQLTECLVLTGYKPRNIELTPAQVDLIIEYLGEP